MSTGRTRIMGSKDSCTIHWTVTEYQKRLLYGVSEYREIETPYVYNGYSDDRQEMTDVVGARGRFNACVHRKRHSALFPSGEEVVYMPSYLPPNWPYSASWTTYGRRISQSSIDGVFTPNGWLTSGDWMGSPGFPGVDWAELVDQVGMQLDGHMATGQNLLVDLMQITQTVGMFKDPFSVRKISKAVDKLSLSKIAKLPAGAYLEYKFGWENIYRDIMQVANVWSEVRQHQNYLEATASKYVSAAARSQDAVSNPSSGLKTLYVNSGSQTKIKLTRATQTACFSLDIKRTEQARRWSKIDQVCSRLGARSLAEALWDVVPYSFVVDWFTHVNRMIRQRKTDFNSFDLRRVGHSVKTDWYGSCDWTATVSGYQGSKSASGSTGESRFQSEYTRYPGIPSGCSSVGLFGNLNKTQIAEGLALIVQRI